MPEREPTSFRFVEAVEARLRRHATPAQLRAAYRAGYLALRPWWFVTRPRTRGAKAVVRHGDEVLLVRHTYARRGEWDLPGGFLHPEEDAREALRRELDEELGVEVVGITDLGTMPARFDHKREVLFTFAVDVASTAVRPSEAEIAEARWFPTAHLPPGTGRLTRRLVARAGWEYWTARPDDGAGP